MAGPSARPGDPAEPTVVHSASPVCTTVAPPGPCTQSPGPAAWSGPDGHAEPRGRGGGRAGQGSGEHARHREAGAGRAMEGAWGGSLLPSRRSAGRGHRSLGEGASNAGRRLSGCGGQTALGPHATGTCLLNISRYPQIASGKGGGDSHGCCQRRGCLSPASCLTATGRLRVGQLPGRDHQDCKRAERVRAPTGVLFSEARALTPSHAVLRSCVSLAGGTPCPQGHGPRVPDHDPRPFPQQEPVGLAETAFPSGR